MAADPADGKRSPAVRLVIDDRDRAKARALRRDRDWDAEGTADVSLPAPLARRALMSCGYVPAAHGGWVGPDGERHGETEEAARLEFTAVALAAADRRVEPMEVALGEIAEQTIIPIGQTLLSPDHRLRALTATVRRIGLIAAAAEPDKNWRPSDGRPGRRFGENVERLRRERGLSIDALAARSGIDRPDLEKAIRGERPVAINAVLLLAGALGVKTDVLFEGIKWHPNANDGSGAWEITGGGQDG